MNMFTAHKEYKRPSEVKLTEAERVDFDFIVATNQDIDIAPWVERVCMYSEAHEHFRRKWADRYPPDPNLPDLRGLPKSVREYMEFEFGPDQ